MDLRYEIQDDISMMTMRIVENAYQVSMKVEENLAQKKVNGTEEKFLAKEEALSEKSSKSPEKKMESIIVR
jgi:uncharacterized protein (DUF2344 family)